MSAARSMGRETSAVPRFNRRALKAGRRVSSALARRASAAMAHRSSGMKSIDGFALRHVASL